MRFRNVLSRSGTAACIAAALSLGAVQAVAQTDDGATGPSSEAATISGGPLNWFRSVAFAGATSTTSTTFQPVPDMSLTVRARRRSNLLITFTAECNATPDTPGNDAIVVVEARVDGEKVPGHADLLFCSNKQFFVETHSYQWVFPVGGKQRRTVEIFYRAGASTPPSRAQLADKILTVQFQRP